MATPEDVVYVRELIDEMADENGWTDPRIGAYLDREGSPYRSAQAIWTTKASTYASLVNVAESGSSRSLGSLQANALRMAEYFKGLAKDDEDVESPTLTAPFSMPIRRPRG